MRKILLFIAVFAASVQYSFAQGGSQSMTGYRGFVDAGYHIDGSGRSGGFEIATSHGGDINQYLFIGAGIGYYSYKLNLLASTETLTEAEKKAVKDGDGVVSVFSDIRLNLADINYYSVLPFFRFKLGYSFGDFNGAYLSPALGIKFMTSRRTSLDLSLGYTAQWCYRPDVDETDTDAFLNRRVRESLIGQYLDRLSLKIGFEF